MHSDCMYQNEDCEQVTLLLIIFLLILQFNRKLVFISICWSLFITESCTAGTKYVPGTGCEPCPIGTYQPENKMLTCIPCQTNYTTKSIGAIQAGDCVPTGMMLLT